MHETLIMQRFTTIMERKDDAYVDLEPELGIASHGKNVSKVRNDLRQAIELNLKYASTDETQSRLNSKLQCH